MDLKKTIKVSKKQLVSIFNIERDNYDKTRFYGSTVFNYNEFNNFINQKGVLRLSHCGNEYFLTLIGENYKLITHYIKTVEANNHINNTLRLNKLNKLLDK